MKDARQVLRYVTPGLLLAIQVAIFCYLLHPGWSELIFSKLMQKDSGVVAVLGAILASGVIGSILSTIHHHIHWYFTSFVDHSGVLKRMVENNILELRSIDNQTGYPDRVQAWNIAVAIWYERCNKDSYIGNADKKTIALTDQMHSMGTALVAAVIASLVIVADFFQKIGTCSLPSWRFVFAVLISVVVIWTTLKSYHRIAYASQAVIDQVLYDALKEEYDKTQKKVVAWVAMPRSI